MLNRRIGTWRLRRILLSIFVVGLIFAVFWGIWWFRWRHGRFDVIVCGGKIFDGDRWIAAPCVGVRDGLIAHLGRLQWASAKKRVHASGLVVAPGFIDLHAHVERNVPSGRPFRAPNFVRMGVTTLVTGNCGTSARNIGQFLDGLDRHGSQVNLATLVGHNTVRESVIGPAPRPASLEEVERMSARVAEALVAGAFGLSTGLAYAPGNHAREGELVALARSAASHKGIYATHLRDEGLHVGQALEEALRIGSEAGVPVHVSHMKVACRSLWGRAPDLLRRIDLARSSGMRVTMDAYAYTASSTSLDILMPPELRGPATPYRAILKDPRRKSQAISGMLAQLKDDGFADYSFARIAYFHRDHSIEGLAIPDVAVRLRLASNSGRATTEVQAETVLALLARGGAQMIYFTMSEEDMLTILRHPQCSIGTDSSVRGSDLRYAHPRGVGNFPRILGQLVREKRALSMEDALRKMTGLAADTFGLRDRGRIRTGAAADLTIFDPQSIADKSSYESTFEAPSGIRWVLVNGVPVVDPDGPTDTNPGSVIRGPGWAGFRSQVSGTPTGEKPRRGGQGPAGARSRNSR